MLKLMIQVYFNDNHEIVSDNEVTLKCVGEIHCGKKRQNKAKFDPCVYF